MNFVPASTYESLRKQSMALASLVACLEARLRLSDDPRHKEFLATKQVDSERRANELLTSELEAAQARIRALELELAIERRPIRDRNTGAGPASRTRTPYAGVFPRYRRFGLEYVAHIKTLFASGSPSEDELHELGENAANLRQSNDQCAEKLAAMDAAAMELLERSDTPIGSLPKDHPFREAARRHASTLARKYEAAS